MTISGFYFEKKNMKKTAKKAIKYTVLWRKLQKKRNNIEEQKVTAPEDIVFSE